MGSLLAATAVAMVVVVTVLAATAEAAGSYYTIPTPATPDFLFSPVFLWVTANVIIVWLLSSSRRGSRATKDDDAPSATDHDDGEVVVPGAVDSYYESSSEYDAFSDAGRRADAPPVSKRQAREARAARRSDRPRVRRKPAGQDAPPAPWDGAVASEARDEREPRRDDERRGQEEETAPVPDGAAGDDEDVSLDTLWANIVQRRAARPVVVQKSESWGNHELPQLQRAAETATARREMRKSVSAVAKAAAPAPVPTAPAAAPPRQMGWRTRDVLVGITPDELLRRAESFIRRQRDHLRLQRQESEQRQLLLQQQQRRLPAAPFNPV